MNWRTVLDFINNKDECNMSVVFIKTAYPSSRPISEFIYVCKEDESNNTNVVMRGDVILNNEGLILT